MAKGQSYDPTAPIPIRDMSSAPAIARLTPDQVAHEISTIMQGAGQTPVTLAPLQVKPEQPRIATVPPPPAIAGGYGPVIAQPQTDADRITDKS